MLVMIVRGVAVIGSENATAKKKRLRTAQPFSCPIHVSFSYL